MNLNNDKIHKKCPLCPSTKFRYQDGLKFCEFGHQIVDYAEEVGDAHEDHLLTKRSMNMGAKIKKKQDTQTLDKRKVINKAHQFILQAQCKSMMTSLNFPKEFEVVCRDLWLLFVQINTFTMYKLNQMEKEPQAPKLSLTELILQNSNLESLFQDDLDTEIEKMGLSEEEKKALLHSMCYLDVADLKMSHNLAILYTCCLIFRIPVFINDVIEMCTNGVIPYLNAKELVPNDQLELLMRIGYSFHEWNTLPKTRAISYVVSQFTRGLNVIFGISCPGIAAKQLTFRIMKRWKANEKVYHWVKMVSELLNLDWRWLQTYGKSQSSRDPEINLLVLCEYAVRALYFNEDQKCSVETDDEVEDIEILYHKLINYATNNPKAFAEYTMKNVMRPIHRPPQDMDRGLRIQELQNLIMNCIGEKKKPQTIKINGLLVPKKTWNASAEAPTSIRLDLTKIIGCDLAAYEKISRRIKGLLEQVQLN